MKKIRSYHHLLKNSLRGLLLLFSVLSAATATCQINIKGCVYGGARQADVGQGTFVNIGGAGTSHDILIKAVYGGNDISGDIGAFSSLPTGLTEATENGIDASYNAVIHTSDIPSDKKFFIGQVYGGGNGDYTYSTTADGNGDYTVTSGSDIVAKSKQLIEKPELGKAYLELTGGTFGYVYGGGNNATVTSATDICINNLTASITTRTDEELEEMDINYKYYHNTYQFSRVFGGNNQAPMYIRPTWHLKKGSIETLYSGGNKGAMHSHDGLLMEIESADMTIYTVYGGCRKADVKPMKYNETTGTYQDMDRADYIAGHGFPDDGYTAHTRILNGNITNVYGGNDVSGRIAGGSSVGVYHSVKGDIYGGGNGSYPYTDNSKLEDDLVYGDFYYDKGTKSAVEALNEFRPNAEQVSIFVKGNGVDNPTVIGGSIYCGGNSATLSTDLSNPYVELKIGPFVYADQVFLGNNGVNMVKNENADDVLQVLASTDKTGNGTKFNSMDLTDADQFSTYMEGAAMSLIPKLTFDPSYDSHPYSTYIGSLYCGGNVGSMTYPGTNKMDFSTKVVIFEKVVGGCNNANVNGSAYNARYEGGIKTALTDAEKAQNPNKLELIFEGLKIQPKRWNADKTALVWNTKKWQTSTNEIAKLVDTTTDGADIENYERRLTGGNIYGGCYSSGHVNGNVAINIKSDIVTPSEVFASPKMKTVTDAEGKTTQEYDLDAHGYQQIDPEKPRNSGVLHYEQGNDVMGSTLNVFGAGYGKDSEIWGSITVNMVKGYAFQVFGGGEMGYVGKGTDDGHGNKTYTYDEKYSTYIYLNGTHAGSENGSGLAEAEYIYGGGLEGDVCGDTHVYLGNGRVYDVLAGACNADILGHTELYIGGDGSYTTVGSGDSQYRQYNAKGYPYIRDNVYGGNDFGGKMHRKGDYRAFISSERRTKIFDGNLATAEQRKAFQDDLLQPHTYVAYIQGRVDTIFGGNYGQYHYGDVLYKKYTYSDGEVSGKNGEPRPISDHIYDGLDNVKQFYKPHFDNSFVYFQPVDNSGNHVGVIFGGSQGNAGEKTNNNSMQERSYILIDDAATTNSGRYAMTDIYGAGAFGGVGSQQTPGAGMTIIDLFQGKFHNIYGGSNREGLIGYARINVPDVSTIHVNAIFGGGQGYDVDDETAYIDRSAFCDTYLSCIDYKGVNATVEDAIYGGNQNCRIACDTYVNIDVPVKNEAGELVTVYGAGYGRETVSARTNVYLNNGAKVKRVYGGGRDGNAFNYASLQRWMAAELAIQYNNDAAKVAAGLEEYSTYLDKFDGFVEITPIVLPGDIGTHVNDIRTSTTYHNTNVHILKGASIEADSNNDGGYAYGGGYGDDAVVGGTTYIELLGGHVQKDLSGGGWGGPVMDEYQLGSDVFTAGTNVYIEGGTVRNVFGGGYQGIVGYTEMTKTENPSTGVTTATITNEYPGETNVVIGIRPDQIAVPVDYGYYDGVPAIQRSVFGGGEQGPVYGTAKLTINNGYIGYNCTVPDGSNTGTYMPNLDEKTVGDNGLEYNGNAFGGGYGEGASTDFTEVTLWNGTIRNSLFGGGEIAAIGRGETMESGTLNSVRTLKGIYKAGKTKVTMYNGHVQRNVFGGGRGYNTWWQTGKLYTDGYVFGQTEVYIHGGEIGTAEGVADGYGNVFGGGDIGYIYSKGFYDSKSRKSGTGSPGHNYYYDGNSLSEDCKVIVAPYLQVKVAEGMSINGHNHPIYDYVETDDLNTLPKKNDDGTYSGGWEKLLTEDNGKEMGVIIHNAVFAGGNVSSNSDKTYANATTVFGNSTATLYDVYHRDFITIGTEHIGGLYGGGNLSVVDGYRELNITNYGTDYYGLKSRIDLDEYRRLSNRERAYFQLEYVCTSATEITINGVTYKNGDHMKEDDYLKLIANPTFTDLVKNNFEPYGFCSIYAGRLLNTIQRADFCGVYGSRMVLQGAKDRVAEVGENIDYTINRVGELSLNVQHSVIPDDQSNPDEKLHGNYFGIYSLVNYMGNLTSDVYFGATYVNKAGAEVAGKTYYSYKVENSNNSERNYGQSHNQVALASGVFLELTTENSTEEHKDYGLISGVVELDLINVKQDQVGGGFVYAKNEHRVPMYYPNKSNVILSEYNHAKTGIRDEARTYKRYQYATDQEGDWSESSGAYVISGDDGYKYQTMSYQTSGNFIHPSKRIVDDCYPTNNAYDKTKTPYSEAHYWYVKGDVYIYDQKVSAYTGSATAYSKEVHLPLTITAASHGKLQLLNVKPNLYAYYFDHNGTKKKIGSVNDGSGNPIDKVTVNNESDSYALNDVITWWDWSQLSGKERAYFVSETFVNCVTCKVDGTEYAPGTYVMDKSDYDTFMAANHDIRDANGEKYEDDNHNDIGKTFVFRSSNNISHDSGYVLTFDMDSPAIWDDYYSPTTGTSSSGKIMESQYLSRLEAATTEDARQAVIDAWREGPTFTPRQGKGGIYGQRQYSVGEVITKDAYDSNKTTGTGAATMEKAYSATQQVTYTYQGVEKTVSAGSAIPETEYNALSADVKAKFGLAWVCTSSVKLADGVYILYDELKTTAQIQAIKDTYAQSNSKLKAEIDGALTPAYICSKAGGYGGQQFVEGTNYSAIKTWCSLSGTDRCNFNFNYDALDLLTDPNYVKVQNNDDINSPETTTTAAAYHSPYTDQVPVEYQAVFKATTDKTSVSYTAGTLSDGTSYAAGTLSDGGTISNEVFENSVRNDQRHYTRLSVKVGDTKAYVAKENFIYLGVPYGKGQQVDLEVYNANQSKVDEVTVSSGVDTYYCYEAYDGNAKGKFISESEYAQLVNDQKYFVIQGKEPTETTTLYVSRESDIYDLMKEKVVTVVYQYTYYEDEDNGSIKMTNELHVINIHLQLESGVPTIGQLNPPATVLPGNALQLTAPSVMPGLYEVLNSGWELFTTADDADHHRNGLPFNNGGTQVYWYQNQKNYIAFYSRTYLGKTYSNSVPISVANYHDLDRVMQDKDHHLYVDKSNVDRPCKIYIDNRACQSDETKNELDLLKDFFDLSLKTTATEGHATLDTHVRGAVNLEFILRSDMTPKAYTNWQSIGNDNSTGCFQGNVHGDGYTISGLNNSLFGHLCGEVYNLGVTGTFDGAGIADDGSGYMENCWVKKTNGAVTSGKKALFGNTEDTAKRTVHLVNCYYPEENAYGSPATTGATEKPLQSFYNGEVAYDLNGFYLFKRYCDSKSLSANGYKFLTDNGGTLSAATGHYESRPGPYLLDDENGAYVGCYVESRFADGDFIYAGGYIPGTDNIRMRVEGEGVNAETHHYPIWPDDYIYFGQALNYGHVNGRTHQDEPSRIKKAANDRLLLTVEGNRVYRAPAYFGDSNMGVAHFNPYAVFAKTKKGNTSVKAYKGMTAIDFKGHNDSEYKYDWDGAKFYPPLLDDGGLSGFQNVDLTRNLLVYTATGTTAAENTNSIVRGYLKEKDFEESNATYHTVEREKLDTTSIHGHWIQNDIAMRDHHLVDNNEFNAPIGYRFGDNNRMWYHRTAEHYVTVETDQEGTNKSKGWLDICLPFEVHMVTTPEKGEITHFFEGNMTGHEYWLRELRDVQPGDPDDLGIFNYLRAESGSKTATNTFLWDYYYSKEGRKDANTDEYRQYYNGNRPYTGYPYQKAGKPYLIGFPGAYYYEFDLSGSFVPQHTATAIDRLSEQPIIFASETGAQIAVSDGELSQKRDAYGSYYYFGNYKYKELAAADVDAGCYMISEDGSKYNKLDAVTIVKPFRPYFTKNPNGTRGTGESARNILISEEMTQMMKTRGVTAIDEADVSENLVIKVKRHQIEVTSMLNKSTYVRIVTPSGLTLNAFTIEPGETIETRVENGGVYIVNAAGGRYVKKLVVR